MAGDRFAGGDHLTLEKDGLRYTLHHAMMRNELAGGYKAFEISNAGKAKSGPSFGAMQYDLGSNSHARKLFEDIARTAVNSRGERIISDAQLNDIKSHLYKPFSSMTAEDKQNYNALKPLMDSALSADQGKKVLYDDYINALDKKIDQVKAIIAGVSHAGNRKFLENDLASQTIIADTLNQYGSFGPQSQAFINGETSRGVRMSGDVMTAADLLTYKMTFQYATENPEDVKRRHNTVVEIAGNAKHDINTSTHGTPSVRPDQTADESGFKPNSTYVPAGGLRVSSDYGTRNDPFGSGATVNHKGADFARAGAASIDGLPIVPAADGKVAAAYQSSSFGNVVVLEHEDADGKPVYTLYAHLKELPFPEILHGKTPDGKEIHVRADEPFARIGNTGRSTGPHLHFQVLTGLGKGVDYWTAVKGRDVNPLTYDMSQLRDPDPAYHRSQETNVEDVQIQKMGQLATLEGQYNAATDATTKEKLGNEINSLRSELAELEINRQQGLDQKKDELQQSKEALAQAQGTRETEKNLLSELKTATVKGEPSVAEVISSHTNADGSPKANPLSAAEQALLSKGTLNLGNDETGTRTDLIALQTVLKEQGLYDKTIDGKWGEGTEKALAAATGMSIDEIKAMTQAGKELSGTQLTEFKEKYLEARINGIDKSMTEITAQTAEIEAQLKELDASRPDLYQQAIDQAQELSDKRTAYLAGDANDIKPEQFFTAEQNKFYNATTDFSKPDKAGVVIEEVKVAQQFLIDEGYLKATYTDKKGVERSNVDGQYYGGTVDAVKAYQEAKGLQPTGVMDDTFRQAMQHDQLQKQQEVAQTTISQLKDQQVDHFKAISVHRDETLTKATGELAQCQQGIENVATIESRLKEDASLNTANPYPQLKEDLNKADIQLTPKGAEPELFKESINLGDKDQAKALQSYMIEQGLLDKTYTNAKGLTRDSNDGHFGDRSIQALNKALEGTGAPQPYIDDKGNLNKESLAVLQEKGLNNLSKGEIETQLKAHAGQLTERAAELETKIPTLTQDAVIAKAQLGVKVAAQVIDKQAGISPAQGAPEKAQPAVEKQSFSGLEMLQKLRDSLSNPEARAALIEEIKNSEVGQKLQADIAALKEARSQEIAQEKQPQIEQPAQVRSGPALSR